MSEHTKGPWHKSDTFRGYRNQHPDVVLDSTGRIVADVYGTGEGAEVVETRAGNLDVIAAAPDLLAACEALLIETHQHAQGDCDNLRKACEQAWAAIRTAKGEQQ